MFAFPTPKNSPQYYTHEKDKNIFDKYLVLVLFTREQYQSVNFNFHAHLNTHTNLL